MSSTENPEPTEISKKAMSKAKKKMPRESIKLQFAGDLILARCPDPDLAGVFRRFEAIFESFANMPKEERILNYKFFCALMLTSHAKKQTEKAKKKSLFDMKNQLFMDIAQNPNQRRMCAFKYLSSKNFRVIEFCPNCTKSNTENELPRHKWKFCNKCTIDRNFFNVVSMLHRYKNGSACIYLSQDHIEKLPFKAFKFKGALDDHKEEAVIDKYHYDAKNLDAIDLSSVEDMFHRILGK
jgi:hypothetical protein